MAQRQPVLVTPFWVRIATETSLSPGWLLIAFPAVLYPTYLLLEVLFGRGLVAATDFEGEYQSRSAPAFATALGYFLMMATYVARGTFRDLDALRPVLRGGADTYAELREQFTEFQRRRLWIGGVVACVIGIVLAELAVQRWTRLLTDEWTLRGPCVAAIVLLCWVTIGWIAVYLIDTARLYSRIGERRVAVNLLDLSPLAPLTRHGLRIVLLLTVAAAANVTFWVPEATHESGAPLVAWGVGSFASLLLAAAVLILPVRGLRRHIQARKAEELAKIREDIRIDHRLVAQRGPDSAEAAARLPGLTVMEKRIESVREWPFDAPTLTRFFLYVAIPLGSWVGGALVERLLGAALD
jgi:hypothetical protein